MTTPSNNDRGPRPAFFSRHTLLAFLAGAVLTGGVAAWAAGQGMAALHHGMMAGATPENVDHMLKHLYAELDVTDAQKTQIEPLVRQWASDQQALHTQRADEARAQLTQALQQTPVDRAALEALRAAHIQLADQESKRFVQLIADVGDTLDATQRKALADHLAKLHGLPSS
jgi:Spy/CpxP family protein refolding chaperone